ncbi:MAG: ATP-binding cassette domain-containing protein [Nitrospirota bacterium]|jgi:ABC-type lipoprotein export system ATPase subunit
MKGRQMTLADVRRVTVVGGYGKADQKEPVAQVEFAMGQVVSVVGPTGSGKTALINDIELFANLNTPSRRKVLLDGTTIPMEIMDDPSRNPVSLITQHTNFLSDLPVRTFLDLHARIRKRDGAASVVEETLDFANQLTGEAIIPDSAMTELSGGQTRALLIADAVVIGDAPILLLDELENAGIHRTRALELLRNYRKIFLFVTHDPRIALLSDLRIVMGSGAMQKVIVTDEEEKAVAKEIQRIDDMMLGLRKRLWDGEQIAARELETGPGIRVSQS